MFWKNWYHWFHLTMTMTNKKKSEPGIEPVTPASIVRCSNTELSRPISTVYLAWTIIFLSLTKSSPSKTHITDTSSSFQDLLNTNAWTGKVTALNVGGMVGTNKYKEIQIKIYGWTGNRTRGTPASLVRCSNTEISRSISTVHLARTTTFLSPRRHTRQTQVHPVRAY